MLEHRHRFANLSPFRRAALLPSTMIHLDPPSLLLQVGPLLFPHLQIIRGPVFCASARL